MEIPDALKLLDRLDLKGRVVTGDAMFCQKSIVAKIVEMEATTSCRSRTIKRTCGRISKRLSTSRFFPLVSFESDCEKTHGRIERRSIDVLPARAAGIEKDWPSVQHFCRVMRFRQGNKNGQWKGPEEEVIYLIASLPAGETAPEALLCANGGHLGIEIMHRNKDVILGEDGDTNRSDNAPCNIFSLIGFALNILKSVSPSPTRAIEQFQDDRQGPSPVLRLTLPPLLLNRPGPHSTPLSNRVTMRYPVAVHGGYRS
jgi:predicted transposase YbfD/YdcC